MPKRNKLWLLAGAVLFFLACSEAPLVPGPGLRILRFAVDDSPPRGDGDGTPNPGETIRLPTWVVNDNPYREGGVVARLCLTRADSSVTLLDTLALLGSLGPGDSACTGDSALAFLVAPGCTTGQVLPLELALTDSCDSTWHRSYDLVVGEEPLQPVRHVVLAEMISDAT